MENLRSLVGIVAIVALGFALSDNRRAIRWRVVLSGLGLQFAVALFVLKTDVGIFLFARIGDGVNRLIDYNREGTRFVFNSLGSDAGPAGFIFAFQILPTVIFVGALMSVLYHLGIMQRIVAGMAWIMMRVMGVSGAESLCCAANVFVGQTEAPLVVKPYIPLMTRSELMALMTGGFATIAGGVLVAYVSMGISAAHLLTGSIMAAPGALLLAKLLVPETEKPETLGKVELKIEKVSANVLDAAASGATDGVKLAINVGGMLIAFVALVALLNGILGLAGYSLERILGWVFWPLAWAMGVPQPDVPKVAALLGQKLALTEFYAYTQLAPQLPTDFESGQGLSPRAAMIASYALCGFANFASIAIQLGGVGSIAENRRHDLARLGLKAMLCGALTTCLTASIAATLVTNAEAEYRQAEASAAAHIEKGDLEKAAVLLRQVEKRHPESRWAGKARAKVEKLRAARLEQVEGKPVDTRKLLREVRP